MNEQNNKLFKKIIYTAFLSVLGLLVACSIIVIILLPVFWLNELVNNFTNFFKTNEKTGEVLKDYREALDMVGASGHLAFDYSELLACSMNEEFNSDITKCIEKMSVEGVFDNSVDISVAPAFAMYKDGISEYKGLLDHSGYLDLWIPTLYEKDHYKQEEIINYDDRGEIIERRMEWVFDYTEDIKYKDYCEEIENEVKCRVVREGFYTYPYISPSTSEPSKRYGYEFEDNNNVGTMKFLNNVSYAGGEVRAISTGIVKEIGTDDKGTFVTMNIKHNGLDFYAKYSGLTSAGVALNQEVEWKEVFSNAGEYTIETFFKDNGQDKYFNPMLLYGSQYNYGAEDYQFVEYDFTPYMGDDVFKAFYEEAIKHLGKPYVLGTAGASTFDCSGFIWYVFKHSGVKDMQRTTAQALYDMSSEISSSEAKPGDLVFFEHTYNAGANRPVTHVGIYLGDGKMIHAGGQYVNGQVYSSVHISNVWTSYTSHYGRLK